MPNQTSQFASYRTIKIQYYALLREERGLSEETVTTEAETAQALYEQLRLLHGFTLPVERLNVALNNEFASWQQGLNDQDTVVFIPPVAGG